MKQPYRVIEPIKYGHYPFGVDERVDMEAELGDELVERGVLEHWPETAEERAARLDAELKLQSDLQRAEHEKAERELAEQRARLRDDSNAAASATAPQADSGAGAPAPPHADSNTPQQSAGSDDASQPAPRDSQDAQSGSDDGAGAVAEDATAPKSTVGAKKTSGKK